MFQSALNVAPKKPGIVASPTGTLVDAPVLVLGMNVITTVGADGHSVALPPVRPGDVVFVVNLVGAPNTPDVYPQLGQDAGVGVNTKVFVNNENVRMFVGVSDTAWKTYLI
jgi:hypothetical protein